MKYLTLSFSSDNALVLEDAEADCLFSGRYPNRNRKDTGCTSPLGAVAQRKPKIPAQYSDLIRWLFLEELRCTRGETRHYKDHMKPGRVRHCA